MKTLELNKDKLTFLDVEDYERFNGHKWKLSTTGYAIRTVKIDGKYSTESLHRVIMNAPKGSEIDHINGDRLDNRKENLRFVDRYQNSRNSKKRMTGTSRFKGVCFNKQHKRWKVAICSDFIGYFNDELEAAQAYNREAMHRFGEYAKLNEI